MTKTSDFVAMLAEGPAPIFYIKLMVSIIGIGICIAGMITAGLMILRRFGI